MQTYADSMFQAFLDVFAPVFFLSFILPMGCQINGEALGYHCCRITPAEGNCHWDSM